MVTDDERREVARRLRDVARADGGSLGDIGFTEAMHRTLGGDGWRDMTARLADLIEPNRGSGGRTILCAHCESASWCGCEPGDDEGGCDFEPSVTEGEPPYNLYSLYEAVLKRNPRDEYAIEDDEVDELVDALLDICNVPGHERIQRSEPAYPDAMASYKGWKAAVYDPDGVLVSPSNVAADLVRTHADGKTTDEPKVRCIAEIKIDGEKLDHLVNDAVVKVTGIDLDALLKLADEMDEVAQRRRSMGYEGFAIGDEDRASRIREALGVES